MPDDDDSDKGDDDSGNAVISITREDPNKQKEDLRRNWFFLNRRPKEDLY